MTDFIGTIPLCLTEPSAGAKPAVLPEKEVARVLGVSVQALRKWRANGVGPAWCKMEGCIRYPVQGLSKYIAETQCDFTGQDKTRSTTNNGGARHG